MIKRYMKWVLNTTAGWLTFLGGTFGLMMLGIALQALEII